MYMHHTAYITHLQNTYTTGNKQNITNQMAPFTAEMYCHKLKARRSKVKLVGKGFQGSLAMPPELLGSGSLQPLSCGSFTLT